MIDHTLYYQQRNRVSVIIYVLAAGMVKETRFLGTARSPPDARRQETGFLLEFMLIAGNVKETRFLAPARSPLVTKINIKLT